MNGGQCWPHIKTADKNWLHWLCHGYWGGHRRRQYRFYLQYIYMWRGIRGSTGPGKGKFRKREGSLTLTLNLTILHSQSFMSQAAGRSQVQGKVSRTIIQWWEDLRPGLKWQTQQQRNGRQVREAHSELRPVRTTRKRESKTINTCGLVGPARQTQGPRQITLITLPCYR